MMTSVSTPLPRAVEGLEIRIRNGRRVVFGELSTPRYNWLAEKIQDGNDSLWVGVVNIWSPNDDGKDGEMIRVPIADLIEALEKRAGEKSD